MKPSSTSLALASIVVALACSSPTTLEPAAAANDVRGNEDAASATSDGIQVIAESGWPGKTSLDAELTPLRVTVRNDTERPLQISYDQFQLRDERNTPYRALPLQEIDGVVRTERAASGYVPPRVSRNFTMSPNFVSTLRNTESHETEFDHPGYTSHSLQTYETQLPTDSMFAAALPEGELAPGGMVEGYLYFEPLGENVERATLHGTFTAPMRATTRVEIPFVVQKRSSDEN